MKREPYIITDETSNEEIVEMIKRAYNEGYSDGKQDGTTITLPEYGKITVPRKEY